MAEEMLIIDDRQSNGLASNLGSEWRMVSDGVMGGVSSGSLALDSVDGKKCLHLRGSVRLENSGGFLQAALDIERTEASNASAYQGLLLEIYGNNETYNLHLRTDDIQRPWQSYRTSFNAPAQWLTVKLPFDSFTAYRIEKEMDRAHLKRIGIVAIGRAFTADLCISTLALY
jgi:hypothetical protein